MEKIYIKPVIEKIEIDHSISLIMMTGPTNPDPRGDAGKGSEQPDSFKSPFGDKPFN